MRNRTLGPFIRWCTDCHRIFFDTRDWLDHKRYNNNKDKHQTHRLITENYKDMNGGKFLKQYDDTPR